MISTVFLYLYIQYSLVLYSSNCYIYFEKKIKILLLLLLYININFHNTKMNFLCRVQVTLAYFSVSTFFGAQFSVCNLRGPKKV